MTPEEIKALPANKVEKGQWIALVHEQSKRVVLIAEYANGGDVRTTLKVISKPSKEELLALIKKDGLTYVEPKAK